MGPASPTMQAEQALRGATEAATEMDTTLIDAHSHLDVAEIIMIVTAPTMTISSADRVATWGAELPAAIVLQAEVARVNKS